MKIVKNKNRLVAFAVGVMLASSAMGALTPPPPTTTPTWVPETIISDGPGKGYFDIAVQSGGHVRFEFSTISGINSAFYAANITPQTPTGTNLETTIKSSGILGMTQASTLALSNAADATNGGSMSVLVNPSFNLLAVHVGLGELLFGWSNNRPTEFNITSQTINQDGSINPTNTSGNLSNYRSYVASGGGVITSPIPEPQAYVMMLAGLLVVGFMVRRRKDGNIAIAM